MKVKEKKLRGKERNQYGQGLRASGLEHSPERSVITKSRRTEAEIVLFIGVPGADKQDGKR